MLDAYNKYRAAGFDCVPTRKDKSPSVPKGTKLKGNWDNLDDYKNAYGIGLWCGNELECLDFDNKFDDALQTLKRWGQIPDVKEIWTKYVSLAIQKTISGGYHVIYKCTQVDGSDKLAMRMNGTDRPECLIETRGIGNYFCVDPTPGYKLIEDYRDILDLPVITPEDRKTLIEAARSFNEFVRVPRKAEEDTDRPGDIYNRSFEAIEDMKHALEDNGWKELSEDIWQRPGKDKGISATLNKAAPGIFYNFSANGDPFEMNKGYTAFQVVALLKYNGDFKQFAKELYEKQKPAQEQSEYEKLRAKLLIDPLAEIGEPPACCYINGNALTFGEMSLWDGKKKSGKTYIIGATVAAMIANELIIDKIKGNLPSDKNMVLYFDTEQSQYHANRSIKRICKLAGKHNPSNLIAFGLRPLNADERLAFIEETIRQTKNLAVVIIDGVRDLLSKGINDEPEATKIVSLFLKWTGEYNIHMPVILHQNKADNNARGHIGTELGNKAETIITITRDKNSDIFTVSCEDSKDENFEDFAFNIEDGTIVSSEMPQEEKAKTKNPIYIDDQKHFEILGNIFRTNDKLSYAELQDAIIYGFDNVFGKSASRAFITHYLNKGWVIKLRDGHKTFYAYTRANF